MSGTRSKLRAATGANVRAYLRIGLLNASAQHRERDKRDSLPQPRRPTTKGASGPVVRYDLTLAVEFLELAQEAVENCMAEVVFAELYVLSHVFLFGSAREGLGRRRAQSQRAKTRAAQDVFERRIGASSAARIVGR